MSNHEKLNINDISQESSRLSADGQNSNNFLNNFVKDKNEIVVCTHVTSPFLKLKTIKKAIQKLKKQL